ncbi:hypothetical protein [Uliginosibacterium aquaticum]|uniref:Uncharacterized protein n=1 Tax=Uliginosibacterium aquaticum TaxID=2731212 RepID=A0ABX2IQX1_9RHOO|nr:hypothetical protein [Uliginosibacterium aquaticum]NSL56633.1 hypothetical protein [Uliginosibacterium aquaticum]
MLTRYLHYLDQEGLTSYRSAGGRLAFVARHATGAEGVATFSQWLQTADKTTHTLLANLADEGFQNDSIPYVAGSDRKALITRKLAQQFHASPYVTSLSLGREREGRRDERILYTGITRPGALDPWLTELQGREAALNALYTPALLTQALLGLLRPEVPQGLIVSFCRAGIRQTYFEQGSLRFSRLSPAPEGDFSSWGEACLRETQKTLQYLSGQRWITRNTRLPVWLLLARQDFAPLLAAVEQAAQLEFHLVNLNTLCQAIGHREQLTNSDSQPLLMRLALRESRAPQLAPEASRRIHRFRQARQLIFALGVLAGLALGLSALKHYMDGRELQQQRSQLLAEIQSENLRYQQLLASLPAQPAPLDSLRSVVEAEARLHTRAIPPQAALLPLSKSLERFPDIELLQLEWDAGDAASTTSPARLVLNISAALPVAAASDPRTALQRIQAFFADLRPRVNELVLQEQPFDAESDKTLRSDAETLRKRPEFKLRLAISKERP